MNHLYHAKPYATSQIERSSGMQKKKYIQSDTFKVCEVNSYITAGYPPLPKKKKLNIVLTIKFQLVTHSKLPQRDKLRRSAKNIGEL